MTYRKRIENLVRGCVEKGGKPFRVTMASNVNEALNREDAPVIRGASDGRFRSNGATMDVVVNSHLPDDTIIVDSVWD